MLTDRREIEIISRARQKNVRDPRRSRAHFERIFADFLMPLDLHSRRLLDLGPGQFDFGELARGLGAEVRCIDNDPAVVELGAYKGFEVKLANLKDLSALDLGGPFDGVFCKFSVNAFWFNSRLDLVESYIDALHALMGPEAWGWIAPWNGAPKKADLGPKAVERVLERQGRAFKACGFQGYDLSESLSRHYGIHGATANRALFVKNLHVPAGVQSCPRL